MVKKLLFSLLIVVLIALPLLTACPGETTPEPTSSQPTSTPTSTQTTAGTGNWYDKFGEPQYGGTLTVRVSTDTQDQPDPYDWGGHQMPHQETLFYRDWAVDRETYHFQLEWAPVDYYGAGIAESWEYTDPLTVTVKIREGVTWPEEAPMNGRDLTAYDVEYTYDRTLGTGHGFTEPNPRFAFAYSNIERAVAVDDYTVEFKLKNDAFFSIYDVFGGGFFAVCIVAQELVDGGYYESWDTASAVGTAPWIMNERTEGVSTTWVRDPDYWGYDARYPENQLPYADNLKYLVIPDTSTALAALRSGKIDLLAQMNTLTVQQAEQLSKSNPELQTATWPSPGQSIHLRCDTEPFNDIKVRTALQMSLDLETIAKTHYGGMVSGEPEGLTSSRFTGWVLPYEEWSDDLKAEYAYDTEGAKALLAEAGYPEGFVTNVVAASSNEDLEVLEIIKAYFMEIGVDMEINVMDFTAKENYCKTGKHDQMSYWNSSGTTRPPQNDIIQHITGQGYTYVSDPVYDEIVSNALAATTEDGAKEYAIEADQYVLQQHWQISLFGSVSPIAWQPWIQGYSGEMIVGALAPWYYARYWIDEDSK